MRTALASIKTRKKKPYKVPKPVPGPDMHKCMPCGYVYDDSKMDAKFIDLTGSYRCPLCSARKDAFLRINTGGYNVHVTQG